MANGSLLWLCQMATIFISEGTYLEITAPKLLRTSADFKPMTEGVELEVHLEEVDGKTNFTFNVIHATEAYKIQQEKMGIYNGLGLSIR